MPIPVSATVIRAIDPLRSRPTCTFACGSLNLIAFESRFQTTCCSRAGSASTGPASGSTATSSSILFMSARPWTASIAASRTTTGSTGRRSTWSLPVTMRDTSSRSSISCARSFVFRSITSRPCAARAEASAPTRRSRAHPSMAVSGVRSSCETIARNSSFALSAARSSRRESSRSRTTRSYARMSRRMPIAPMTVPSGSQRAEALSVVGITSPDALRGFSRTLRVTPRSTTSRNAAMNSRVSSAEMMRDNDCSMTSSGRNPSSVNTASLAWRILPRKSLTKTGSGAFLIRLSAYARALSSSRMSRRIPMTPMGCPRPLRSAEAFNVVGITSPDALPALRRTFRVTPCSTTSRTAAMNS